MQMKKLIQVTALTSSLILFLSCDKAKNRDEKVDPKISANMIVAAEVHDITNDEQKAYLFKGEANNDIKKQDQTQQIQLNSDTLKILSKITQKDHQQAIEDALNNGLVAFVVLNQDNQNQIKIFKVIQTDETTQKSLVDTTVSNATSDPKNTSAKDASDSDDSLTLDEVKKMKDASYVATPTAKDINTSDQSVKTVHTEFIEITSIKIESAGVLAEKKTDYNETTSLLNVAERPLDLSTHYILGDELTTEQPASP